MKLFVDKWANYEVLLEFLNDAFKITKNNIKKTNHYEVNNKFDKSKSFVFAQDPTDFICADNIEKIKSYLPC